jgi:DNA-binding HxlR family transcriptional regulator
MEINGKHYVCNLDFAMDLIRGKWKAVILCHLKDDPTRFSDLVKRTPGISEKVLSEKLRELETDGLIIREVRNELPPHVVYRLTPTGKQLFDILLQLQEWSKNYLQEKRVE